jgi:hypothetical protein
MFPRKTKKMDFLDILQDTDRKDFQSPIKSPVQKPTILPPSSPVPTQDDQKQEMAVEVDEEVTDDLDAEIYPNPEEEGGTYLRLDEIDLKVLDTIQEDEEHPHFALLAYLAELASVRDPAPEDLPSVEEVTHGSIEDILTAAALAESFQDEIFITEDAPAPDVDQEDEEVDIMNVMEDMVLEPSVHPLVSTMERQESTAPSASIEDEVVAEVAEMNPVDELGIDKAAVDDFDAESLISYSEAEITVEASKQEGTQDLQIPSGHSANDAIVSFVEKAIEEVESTVHLTEMVTPAETVGINETGQFTSPAINIFEDQVNSDNPSNPRQPLDHSVIFSFSATQIVIPSPPKRQISDNQENSVIRRLFQMLTDSLVSRNARLSLRCRIRQDWISSESELHETVHEKLDSTSNAVISSPPYNPSSTTSRLRRRE